MPGPVAARAASRDPSGNTRSRPHNPRPETQARQVSFVGKRWLRRGEQAIDGDFHLDAGDTILLPQFEDGVWKFYVRVKGSYSTDKQEYITLANPETGTVNTEVLDGVYQDITEDIATNELSEYPSSQVLISGTSDLNRVPLFSESFPMEATGGWDGLGQDEVTWKTDQGSNPDNVIINSISNGGPSPQGIPHLTFQKCGGGYIPTPTAERFAWTGHIDLSHYTNIEVIYYYMSSMFLPLSWPQ